jgi:hypothetical protein
MARIKSAENAKDPATGRPLPDGVSCRGPKQYRARKLVNGQRIIRTWRVRKTPWFWPCLCDSILGVMTGGMAHEAAGFL